MRKKEFDVPIDDGGSTMRVVDEGNEGSPVVFMTHSILSSSAMWDQQAALLLKRGWRVIRPNARGHGGSSTQRKVATMHDLVTDNLMVMDALNLRKVHYVGLSLGGMAGFGLGILHPSRFHSLCLCDARADAPLEVSAPWDERIDIAERAGCEALADATIERWFGATFLRSRPKTAQKLKSIAASTQLEGFIACARAIQSLDYAAHVHEIQVPTRLIVGANDGALPAVNAHLRSMIKHCSLELIADAGHLPNVQNPEMFNSILLTFLGEHA